MAGARVLFGVLMAAALCACGGGGDGGRRTDGGAGSVDGRKPLADVRDPTAQERAEIDGLVDAATAGRARSRPAPELAAAIEAHRRAGATTSFDEGALVYKIVDGVVQIELPTDAVARGIKAIAGVEFAGAGPVFAKVYATYMVFDDPDAAEAYHRDLDTNLGAQQYSPSTQFTVDWDDYPQITLRCVFVPDAQNSLNCHYLTPDKRIVVVLLPVGGPDVAFSGQEPAVDQVLAQADAKQRVGLAGAASWAYLSDAIYR